MTKRSSAAALAAVSVLACAALVVPRATLDPAWGQAYGSGGTAVQNLIAWNEASGQTLAASSSYNGAIRDGGSMGGQVTNLPYFQATCYSNVTGTLSIFGYTVSNGSPVLMGTVAIGAGGTNIVKVPAFGVRFQASFTNTSTNVATFTLSDGFTGS